MAYNPIHKLRDNIAAIRMAMEGGDDVNVLSKFSGFGGIKAILFPRGTLKEWQESGATKPDLKLYDDIQAFHEWLVEKYGEEGHDRVIGSLKNSVLSAFYTPAIIPATIYRVLTSQGITIKSLYEPSAGAGVFVSEAIKELKDLEQVIAVEKDTLTAAVLAATCKNLPADVTVHATGFENTSDSENGQSDLIISNIPFGNFNIEGERIHNYFFPKGLEKIKDGGLLAYITTDGFLYSPANQSARSKLFAGANLISVTVMPDNLMKETGNTEAPNHLIVVQKNNSKSGLSDEEALLIETVRKENEYGEYSSNAFIDAHPEIICADEIKAGTNQYGHANLSVWQTGDINHIGFQLERLLQKDFAYRFSHTRFLGVSAGKELTFLAPPQGTGAGGMQLDLFGNPALNYITAHDGKFIKPDTAIIAGKLLTVQRPEHPCLVLISAKSVSSPFYIYKLFSHVKEFAVAVSWTNAAGITTSLDRLRDSFVDYRYDFRFEGEKHFAASFGVAAKEEKFDQPLPHYREGTLVVLNDRAGTIDQYDNFTPLETSRSFVFYKQYIEARDCYFMLAAAEQDGEMQNGLREKLNTAYQLFLHSYGQLNDRANRKYILEDALGFVTLSSLERQEGERFVQADIFFHSVFKVHEGFTTEDPVEALAHCLNEKGHVAIDYIAAMTGSSSAETVTALQQHIYLHPVTGHWETADQWLSGNVVAKLKSIQDTIPDRESQRSLAALLKVQPQNIPFELLDFNLGERWMPVTYFERFATELFETNTTINYLPSVDSFKVLPVSSNAKINNEYAIPTKSSKTMYGHTLLEHALENTSPYFTYTIDDKRYPDNEATQLAHQKIESVRNKFVEWLAALPKEDKAIIETLYNETFNCYVLREYNGSHLNFPGLNRAALGIADLYNSQKNAAWRIIQNRGALIDHEVGLGKTLTMIVAAHEMKRLGIVHKPVILALKSNVSQIADTYRKAYPKDKILYPGENDFTPSRRQQLFHAIKNNNWDCIILTHDQFGKIPQSPEMQREIFEAEIDNIERDLITLQSLGNRVSKAMLKGLEIRKANLQSNLSLVLYKIEQKKDADINFKELGIDHLFIDEAHKFKNLTFTTRHNRVAGLGNTEGSQKALNLLFAIRTLQDRFQSDLCVTFLSGTPISNSLTEMYLLFKYLRPYEMKRQQIGNFDAWAAVFAKKSTDFEFSVTNEIIAKERFRHFIKVPELALFYNEITDYKTAKQINLDKPILNEVLVNIKPSEEQVDFIKKLMEFARTGDGGLIGRPQLTGDEDKGRMLIATNYAKKMAADLRLIDPIKYDDHPHNKVSVCAKKVSEIYFQTKEHRGTQIVFSDIGTPKPDAFTIYAALKTKLINEYAIPVGEITFIHDWSDSKKPELFRKMNAGHIRILLGSTDKAGTGLNVQQRVVAMHHLDIPWKPSELEQRNGRGARQGNEVAKKFYKNEVRNFIYAVEQSLDNYKFNLLKNKQTFISQMKNCELHVRSIDEGALDEKTGMNFSEYIAILSGDSSLLEKSKMDKQVAVLESLRAIHFKEIARTRVRLEMLEADKVSNSTILEQLVRDGNLYHSLLRFDKDGVKLNPLQLKGTVLADPELTGAKVVELYKHWAPAENKETIVGTLYDFNCYIRQQQESFEEKGLFHYRTHNAFYVQHKEGGIKYTYNQGHPSIDNLKLAARHFLSALDRVTSIKGQYEAKLKELDDSIPVLQGIIGKPFEKDAQLKAMKIKLAELEKKISDKIVAGQKIKKGGKDESPKEEKKEKRKKGLGR